MNVSTGKLTQIEYTAKEEITWAAEQAAWAAGNDDRKAEANKATAKALLLATDWAILPDVTIGTPSLTNQAEFITYRNAVRAIAVNPPTTPATFPDLPVNSWSE